MYVSEIYLQKLEEEYLIEGLIPGKFKTLFRKKSANLKFWSSKLEKKLRKFDIYRFEIEEISNAAIRRIPKTLAIQMITGQARNSIVGDSLTRTFNAFLYSKRTNLDKMDLSLMKQFIILFSNIYYTNMIELVFSKISKIGPIAGPLSNVFSKIFISPLIIDSEKFLKVVKKNNTFKFNFNANKYIKYIQSYGKERAEGTSIMSNSVRKLIASLFGSKNIDLFAFLYSNLIFSYVSFMEKLSRI